MKVVGYAGSRSAFSKSICLGEKLKTMLREKNIEMELYTARNNVVEECRGCGKCFDEALCPQDQEDSMECIRKKILEADLIVLLSPVYLNNVSGAMKTFLDRIGSWVHTLRKRA
jgi:multimeric flavodoxin WrbA